MSRSLARKIGSGVLLTATLALALPAAALAETPPATLSGEQLLAMHPAATGTVRYTHVECNPDGESAVTYEATGTAYGPYPGTFRETGQYTFGPQDGPLVHTGLFATSHTGRVTDFHASFTIESAVATVTGTKVFSSFYPFPAVGHCSEYDGDDTVGDQPLLNVSGELTYMNIEATYIAQIHLASGGTWQDRGRTYVDGFRQDIQPGVGSSLDNAAFSENYMSLGTLEPLGPAFVTVSPAYAVNPVGTEHTVTITVTTAAGTPAPDPLVLITISSRPERGYTCATNELGECTFTYTGPLLPGADVITACADANDNGRVDDPGDPCGEAIKVWMLPASTPGQVTGGGYIVDPEDNERVAFGFNAQSTSTGIKGNCTVVDAAPVRNVKIKCLTVTTLVQTATHATFFGQAEVNGVVTDYRIDVDDNAEPGKGRDTFKIVTGSGYSAAGILDGGNIQLHRAG